MIRRATSVDVVRIDSPERVRAALSLLQEGFRRREEFFLPALVRIDTSSGVMGALLLDGGTARGVLLSFCKTRILGGVTYQVRHLSSWYVRESHRAHSLSMLSSVLSNKAETIIDSSPTPPVRRILKAFGFREASPGCLLVPTLSLLPHARDTNVSVLKMQDLNNMGSPFVDHCDARFIWFTLPGDEIALFAFMRKRGISVARLLYTSNFEALRPAIRSISQHLLARRVVAVLLPRGAGLEPLYGVSLQRYPIMVRGPRPLGIPDLLYSEHTFLDWRQ